MMKRNLAFVVGLVIAVTLAAVELNAQRGQGHRPPDAGHGKPSGTPGKPATTPPEGDNHGRPDPSAHGGRPTVAALMTQNTALASRVQSLLPGANLEAASAGFRNLGEFVAAAHVSHNLDISFDQLKAKLTGPNAENLGKAIKDLKPSADANAEAKKAEKSSQADIKASRNLKASS
jgi:hypothetical protein